MSSKDEVLTATSSEGETSFMVCKTDDENKNQKLCSEVGTKNIASSNRTSTEKGMLDNNTYDLMEQLIIENKSLWRIKNNYKNDSTMDNENRDLWNFIEKDKEEIVRILTEKLRERL